MTSGSVIIDREANLSTGNLELDQLVQDRIEQYYPTWSQSLSLSANMNLLVAIGDSRLIYLTLEKSNQSIYDINDCQQIRTTINTIVNPIILSEAEARQSPFFDDYGDIKLGFTVAQPIEFI